MSQAFVPSAEPGGDDAGLASPEYRDPVAPEDTARVIPLRLAELERLLLDEPGSSPADRERWARLARLLGATLRNEFRDRRIELHSLYAPLDPDTDCVRLVRYARPLSQGADEAFLAPFEEALIRANYRKLDLSIIENAVSAPNELGLTYVPDFALFEHLTVYVRGATKITRVVRSLRTKFRKRTVVFDGYRRLMVALKFRPGKHLGLHARSDVLYLRLFKDVPHVDMEMHLPEQGTRVRMRMIDKAQIASPLVTGLPVLAAKILLGMMSPWALGALVAPLTAGVNSFFGFRRARQRHLHYMIRNLYYLSLANNASVIDSVLNAAEDEEIKEALLAYFLLRRRDGDDDDATPWDPHRLDAAVEAFLRDRAGLTVDFEIGDALHKLHRLGLVVRDDRGGLRARPIVEALAHLDRRWDDCFGPDGTALNKV